MSARNKRRVKDKQAIEILKFIKKLEQLAPKYGLKSHHTHIHKVGTIYVCPLLLTSPVKKKTK